MTGADQNADTLQWDDVHARIRAGEPVVWCESPALTRGAAIQVSGDLRFTGWALSPAGLESVTVEVVGRGSFAAEAGGRRPDIHKVFHPADWSRRPGFELAIPTGGWLPGRYDVNVSARDTRGSIASVGGSIEWLPSHAQLARDVESGVPALWIGEPRPDASDPLGDAVSVRGWASAPEGVESVLVELDGVEPAVAFLGDAAYAPQDDLAKSSFAVVLDATGLGPGRHALSVEAVGRDGSRSRRSGSVPIDPGERHRRRLAKRPATDTPARRDGGDAPSLRVHVTEGRAGATLARSLEAQTHAAPDVASIEGGVDAALSSLLDSGDAAAVFVAAGDSLEPGALAAVAARFERPSAPDLVYADHDSLDATGRRAEPFHKPGWSPELLLSFPYVGSFVAVGPRAAEAALRRGGGHLDSVHALLLALADEPLRFERIPEVLWTRGARAFDEVSEREDPALEELAARRGARLVVGARDTDAGIRDVAWQLDASPSVSIVIPTTGDATPLSACLRSLRDRTAYPDVEVVLVESGAGASDTAAAVGGLDHRVVPYDGAEFNFSRACNLGAREAGGDYIAFVNDDVEALDDEWLVRMVAQAQLPATGVVGAKLLYPGGLVQHAGLVLDRLSTSSGLDFVAAQFAFHPEAEPGPRGLMDLPRDCSAVTGACLMMRSTLLEELRGWDEGFRIDFGDVDLCLRAIEAGRRVVVEPRARLLHHVHATQGQSPHDEDDARRFLDRWAAAYADGDPWYHPACVFGRDWEVG